MEIVAYSRPAVVAYQDLLRLHLGERASSLVGTIEERQRDGRTYLYERFGIGTEMMSRYLAKTNRSCVHA
ncbi:hypothetical protein [Chelativorans salis]|uniref:Uncharacterized protein n=1 Tax=Chelativorans salis TaxID=2978478 RepID=A0ABT2LVQ9_9HYPH|nr:hypothetical protein [Chelativorans sp. EGI FJ00035]MCT7377952.1 hypothetical protein [Chelativorans sp. EGI FJ00035]